MTIATFGQSAQRCVAAVLVLLCMSRVASPAQIKDTSSYAGRFGVSVGFLSTNGDMRTIWTDGISLSLFIAYDLWGPVGLEGGFIYGFTGITDQMVNEVATVTKYTNVEGTSKATGGDFIQGFLGPSLSFRLFRSDLVLSLGAGGTVLKSSESGMGDIEGYTPRGTSGWGYYVQGGLRMEPATGSRLFYGLTARYTSVWAKVGDFYNSMLATLPYGQIPPGHIRDNRLDIYLHIGVAFH